MTNIITIPAILPRRRLLCAAMLGLVAALPACSTTNGSPAAAAASADATPAAVLALMERVGDWQLAHPSAHPSTDWTQGVGDAGVMALARVSAKPAYRDAMLRMGEQNGWQLGPRPYHADDHVVGQTYIELYLQLRQPAMIAPLKARFDAILAQPYKGTLEFTAPNNGDAWSWCDALFMGPPAWVRLSAATGDRRYRDFAVAEWWRTSDYLYDPSEQLYFRDSNYFKLREANGRKVFWSRGNGWVMAGFARTLEYIPAGDPARTRLEAQFRAMADKIVSLQQPDGLWRSSLLDPASYPMKETSGTALFTYALAWGVNQGLLERARFEPAVRRAWRALAANVAPDGMLTHVQPIGQAPKTFPDDSTEVFGVGAFLMAGSEMIKLVGG